MRVAGGNVLTCGLQDSAPATEEISILPVNDAPVAFPQSLNADMNTPIALTLSGIDTDQDSLSYRIINAPSHGSLSGTAPDLTYLPESDFSGPDSFSFVVNDGQTDSAAATISIEVRDSSSVSLIHAASLDLSLMNAGKNWKASALVNVTDQGGNPMPGASVSGTWSLDGNSLETIAGITDGSGAVVLTSSPEKVRSGAVFTFTLGNISHADAVYDQEANVQTSTSVTVP